MSSGPLVLEIKGNSLDDGPGIRSVIFFKGCPLSCVWCHNPESKSIQPELSYDAEACIGCESCIEACPQGAISSDNRYFIDRAICDLCFTCVEVCPAAALTRVGKAWSIDNLAARVLRDRPFYETSGGGVTISGGEPTLNMEFLSRLVQRLHNEGIHILLETCGVFNMDTFLTTVYPYIDMIYFDIKIFDSDAHKKFCEHDNVRILENFQKLYDKYLTGGIEILPRTPLVPGITDTEKNLSDISQFLHGLGADSASLLEYNPLWHSKNEKIGTEDPLKNDKQMHEWLSKEKYTACREIFKRSGVAV